MAKSSLYDLLEVSPTATPEEIKAAYRTKAMKHHPDRNPGDASAEEQFKAIQHAYDVLSDPARRAEYDSTGESQQQDPNALAYEIFAQMFLNIANSLTEGGNPNSTVPLGRTDLLAIMLSQLREQARGIERSAQMNTLACERLKQILARLHSKQGSDNTPLHEAMQAQITQLEARKFSIERDRDLNLRLQRLTGEFTYQIDTQPTRPTTTATTGTLFIQNHV